MNVYRLRAAWIVLLLAAAVPLRADPLIDPFLERFRVGAYRDAAACGWRDGWPVDLFLPCRIDSLWRATSESTLALAARPESAVSCIGLLEAALGGSDERCAWADRQRARVASLGAAPLAEAGGEARPWLAEEALEISIVNNYNIKNYGVATLQTERLLSPPLLASLPAESRFVWSLRLRGLRELAGRQPAPAEAALWPELLELGSYDADSGWTIWSGRQRALQRPLLPPGSGDAATARFLATVDRTGLTGADLEQAGFSPDALAATGAACLDRGPALDEHFARHAEPPADPRFQEIWLRGRLRATGGDPAQAETWAQHGGLHAAARVRLWRRASEQRLLAGEWAPGLADLERAFAAARDDGALRAQVAAQSQQAALLAAVRHLTPEATRIRELARAQLPAPEWAAWQEVLAPAWAQLGGGVPPDTSGAGDLQTAARRRVRAGLSRGVSAATPALPVGKWPDAAAGWDVWLTWGLRLAAQLGGNLADARATEYRDALEGARAAATPAAREALARAAVGRFFHGHPLRDTALHWLLERERRRAGGPQITPAGPSLPITPAETRPWPDRHAWLGLALAAGEAHAQLILSQSLSAAGLPERDRLPFLYPVPGPGPLRTALGETGVDPLLLLAVARNESQFDPAARSRAGALGWLQIMPFHYPEGGAPRAEPLWRRPVVSLRTGARLLVENARAFGGDPYRATAAYNAGGEAVRRWIGQLDGHTEPALFLPWIGYAETRAYVEKVLIDREIYAWIVSDRFGGTP